MVAEMMRGGGRVEVVPERKSRKGEKQWWGGKKKAQDVMMESAEDARTRVKRILDEESKILLTLKVTGAERIGLRWTRDPDRGAKVVRDSGEDT